MGVLTEVTVAAIFHHFAEFLRKTGDLGIFDTLVHNYRLKESLTLSKTKLEDFSRELLQLITTVQNLMNPSKSNPEIHHSANSVPFNHSVMENGNQRHSEVIRPSAANSIEINWTGSMRRQSGRKKRKTIEVKRIKEKEAPKVAVYGGGRAEDIGRKTTVPESADGIFCCRTCSRIYKSKQFYMTHCCPKKKQCDQDVSEVQLITDTREIENLKLFVCGICLQAMKTYDRIILHLKKCEGGPYTCEFCDSNGISKRVTFDSLKGLNRHKRTEHANTSCFVCNECDLSFRRKQSLVKHKRCRHEKHSFPCPSCDQVFDRRINLTNHKLKDHEVKRCTHCGTGCSSDAKLSAHIALKHNSETDVTSKKFTCGFCQKEFPRKDKLEFHLSTHTGEKPFICATCGKAFSRKFKLEDHEARHLGIKKYPCTFPNCAKAYASNADLKIHSMKQHEGVPQFAVRRNRKRKSERNIGPVPSVAEILLLEVNSADFQSVEAGVEMEGLSQGITRFQAFSEELIERLPPIALETQTQSFTATSRLDYEYQGDSYFISDAVPNRPVSSTTGNEYSMANELGQGVQFMVESDNTYPQNFYGMGNNNCEFLDNPFNSGQTQNHNPYPSEVQEFANETVGNNYLIGNTDMVSSSFQEQNSNMVSQYDYVYQRRNTFFQVNSAQDFDGCTLDPQFQSIHTPFGEQEPLSSDTHECEGFSVDVGTHRMPP